MILKLIAAALVASFILTLLIAACIHYGNGDSHE
jgi:hypothetical protein